MRRAFQDFATGRFTKDEVRKSVNTLGLTTRRGKPVPSQTFDAMLRNRVYIGQVDVPDFNVSVRGDFEPLVTDKIFFRVQAILDGRYEVTAPRQSNDPDFPLRGYVRCETCGKPLTASWSKGRSDYYAYYHCRSRCRAVNIAKAKLEDLFVDELARLQPTAGFMRLVKDRVLDAWRELKGDAQQRIAEIERRHKTIRERLDRLDEAFLYERSIDIDTYDRHRDKLREEMTIAQMDRHASELEEMDVEGIWPWQSAFCRARRASGSSRRSLRSSDCSSCSFRTGCASTGRGLLEPGQPSRFQLLGFRFGREKGIGRPEQRQLGTTLPAGCIG